MKPTVGRIVHYWEDGQAQPHAAIITHVWSDDVVNLRVFRKDTTDKTVEYPTSVVRAVEPKFGCWNWPPREGALARADEQPSRN